MRCGPAGDNVPADNTQLERVAARFAHERGGRNVAIRSVQTTVRRRQ
jgi:hypothetical protein